VKQSRDITGNVIILELTIVALLLSLTPAVAQTNNGTASNTGVTVTTQPTNNQLLQGTEFEKNRDVYNGMGEPIPVRKDAWTWYWNEKAHLDIDPQDKAGFYGNDRISEFFEWIANSFAIPFWNGAMEYDFIRAGVLLIIAGMLLGLGASVFLQKDKDKEK